MPKDEARSRERVIEQLVAKYGCMRNLIEDACGAGWDAALDAAAKQFGTMIARYNSDDTLQQIIRTEAAALKGNPDEHQ